MLAVWNVSGVERIGSADRAVNVTDCADGQIEFEVHIKSGIKNKYEQYDWIWEK